MYCYAAVCNTKGCVYHTFLGLLQDVSLLALFNYNLVHYVRRLCIVQ